MVHGRHLFERFQDMRECNFPDVNTEMMYSLFRLTLQCNVLLHLLSKIVNYRLKGSKEIILLESTMVPSEIFHIFLIRYLSFILSSVMYIQ
jgi:hypothetical protein